MMRGFLRSSLLTLASLLSVAGLHAQQYYNQTDRFLKYNSVWHMFRNIKLDFNTGSGAVAYASMINGDEGYASVADPNTGALLFYSNGGQCWNSNNAVMPNGNGLLGNATTDYSTAQGVCIVPIPGETQKYYLFSLETTDMTPTTAVKLYYSIVDMTLDNGLGDIVAGSKNTVLDGNTMLSESMLAIQGDNCDVWLMLHTRNTPVFKAYHITAAGINPNPVVSTTGGQIQGTTSVGFGSFVIEQDAYDQSTITVSPDRNKLVISCQHLGGTGLLPVISSTGRSWGGLLCDFNAATGVVSNAILIDTTTQYSAAFSPDNNMLYYTSIVPGGTASQVNQVNVSSNDSATIVATKAVIQPSIVSSNLISIRSYRDSIYIMNPATLSLDRINKPNLAGAACDYQNSAISFAGTNMMGTSLPTEVVYAAGPDTVRSRILDTLICGSWGNGIKLRPADQTIEDNYTWSNGSTDSTTEIMTAGTYWVKYGNSCHYRVDTFVLTGSDLDPIITVNVFELSTTIPYNTYQWYLNGVLIPGATNSTYTVTENGAYTVAVSDGTCTDTSAVYNVTNVLGIEDVSYWASRINIYPNPTQDIVFINAPVAVNVQLTGIEGRAIRTIKNAKQISVGDLAAGIYLMRITDKDGTILKVEKIIREK
jgi:hypothetical protein